jgi:hypothetical protein
MLRHTSGLAVTLALLAGSALAQTPATSMGITIFPKQERTITIYRHGLVVGVQQVPAHVGPHLTADGGVTPPGSGSNGHFVAHGTGEIRLVEFPLPDVPRSPGRLADAFATALVVLSLRDTRVTVSGPSGKW